ncbi:MAG: tol-pal system-associated acyl-CoA thioesterase [Pseudomonadota bacterium]
MSEFSWPVRVYYEDTDAGGVVYHANYLRFMERGRTEWLRALGFDQRRMAEEQGVVFAVRRATTEFIVPAVLDDELLVLTGIGRRARVSMTFEQRIIRQDDGVLLCSAENQVASLNAGTFRPCPVPATIIRAMEGDGER